EFCSINYGLDNIGERFAVTLIQSKEDKWTAEPSMSDEETRLWADIEMVNVAIPGSQNLYYYIPIRIYDSSKEGDKTKTTLQMIKTQCRKARDEPT
ncbi:hypothetical protein PFISCL1PPCAC_2238, partial [Pristionchus fissidentatus]